MRRIAFAAAAYAGLNCTGCMTVGPVVAPAVSSTTFSYPAGRATQDFAYPIAAVQSAVAGALDDLRIHSVRSSSEGITLIYHGTTADNRRAAVSLWPNQGMTRVAIRLGWFGDEPLSKALMDRVAIRLGALPPAAIPEDPPSAPESNPYFSRDAIPDEVMLRDQADAMYRDSPIP